MLDNQKKIPKQYRINAIEAALTALTLIVFASKDEPGSISKV